jgi:hypothetical protein
VEGSRCATAQRPNNELSVLARVAAAPPPPPEFLPLEWSLSEARDAGGKCFVKIVVDKSSPGEKVRAARRSPRARRPLRATHHRTPSAGCTTPSP